MRRIPLDNFRNPAAMLAFLLTAAVGIALDLWTKALAVDRLYGERRIEFIPGWLHFQYTENRGAVFGYGQGMRWLFIGVSIVAVLFLTGLFALSQRRQWIYQILLGMLLAGVLGNLYDRALYGYVRDMIHALPRWPTLFPYIFNVADSLLCFGVFVMVVYSFFHKPAVTTPRMEPQMNADSHR
jgi:signal peptidase II